MSRGRLSSAACIATEIDGASVISRSSASCAMKRAASWPSFFVRHAIWMRSAAASCVTSSFESSDTSDSAELVG